MTLANITYLILIPFEICFGAEIMPISEVIFVALLGVNMILQMNTSFYKNGELVQDRKQILNKYLKTRLVYDLISMLCVTRYF